MKAPSISIKGGIVEAADRAFYAKSKIGFYGCFHIDRIVRVGEAEPRKYTLRQAEVDCPCGRRHRVGLSWRGLREDEDAGVEVLV